MQQHIACGPRDLAHRVNVLRPLAHGVQKRSHSTSKLSSVNSTRQLQKHSLLTSPLPRLGHLGTPRKKPPVRHGSNMTKTPKTHAIMEPGLGQINMAWSTHVMGPGFTPLYDAHRWMFVGPYLLLPSATPMNMQNVACAGAWCSGEGQG